MTPEKAFYYFVAMYGYGKVLRYGGPDDAIEIYGKSFDAGNYERAMADEFERNRYKERIRAKIADEVRKIDFSEKFTFVAVATLGEYSFGSHSFPFVWDLFQEYSFCVGPRNDTGNRGCRFLDVTGFRVRDAVNGNDFNWSVPMSETDASAFVKSRSTDGTGKVDRRIAVRITYSVVNRQGQEPGTNFIGEYSHPIFSPFIYSVEAYGDESLTQKLGVIPKINSLGPSTAEEWRLATVAAQTATKEIGKYPYMTYYRDKGSAKLENPLRPRPARPQLFGTITLTDVGVTLVDEQPDGSSEKLSKSFFDLFALVLAEHGSYGRALGTHLWRANYTNATWGGQDFRVVWPPFWKHDHDSALRFETAQERDRFFVDLARALQEWKTKYAPFQFAAGQVNVYQQCESGGHFFPCSESTLSDGKPVWQTPTYRVTVESLERNANDYIATLVFENLTDETIEIGWEEKSNLLPDAVGPYLINERGEKYFAEGTDSGNIISDGVTWLWESHTGILPKSKLKSRFLFSGNGNGSTFTLRAKEMQGLGTKPVIIEGLKIGN